MYSFIEYCKSRGKEDSDKELEREWGSVVMPRLKASDIPTLNEAGEMSEKGWRFSTTGFAVTAVTESPTRARAVESSLNDISETRKGLQRRELAIEEKEKESYQMMADIERKHRELMEEKAELEAQMEAFYDQKDAFYAQNDDFLETREKLMSENAMMKKELA
ncbi:hypothetical protein BGX21_005369, partial [Mortierella sp. AD011]